MNGLNEKEINDLFKDCHSNLETPLMGGIITPQCKSCKHVDKKSLREVKKICKIIGQIPDNITFNTEKCHRYEKEEN